MKIFSPFFAVLLFVPWSHGESIELPEETATYRPGPGVELAQGLCITCHSADYTSMQPPMPRKFWEATVAKMKDKFGAPLPDDTTALVDYLMQAYGAKE